MARTKGQPKATPKKAVQGDHLSKSAGGQKTQGQSLVGRKRPAPTSEPAADGEGGGDSDEETPSQDTPTKAKLVSRPAKKTKTLKKNEAANLTDATASGSTEERYAAALPSMRNARDADLEKRIAEGKGRDKPALPDYGVYIVNAKYNVESNQAMAGYLNLKNTSQLNTVIKALREPLTELLELAKDNYGVDPVISAKKAGKKKAAGDASADATPAPSKPQLVTLQPPLLFARLADGNIYKNDVESDDEPNEARYPTSGGNLARVYLHLMRFARKMMEILAVNRDLPPVFTGCEQPKRTRQFIDGLNWHGEDIYRVLVFWSWFRRKHGKITDNASERGVYAALPFLPIYNFTSGTAINTDEQAKRQARALHAAFGEESSGITDMTGAGLIRQFQQGMEVTDEESATNVDNAATAGEKVSLRSDLDHMSDEVRNIVMKAHSSGVEVLYDDPARQNKFFFGKIRDTKEAVGKAGIRDAEADAALVELAEGHLVPQSKLDADRQRFFDMQTSINRRSAKPPSFDDAAADIGLVITTDLPEPDPITMKNFKLDFHGLTLKPWQPQGISWLKRMINSPTKGAILADDTGLGKTLMSYGAIVADSAEVERRDAEWLSAVDELCDPYLDRYEDGEEVTLEQIIMDQQLEQEIEDTIGPRPVHKPVLVVVPPTALVTWAHDHSKFFAAPDTLRNIILRTYGGLGGSKSTAEERARAITGDWAKFQQEVQSWDPRDPQTSRTVVLTTFQSWHGKVLNRDVVMEKPKAAKPTRAKGKGPATAARGGDGDGEVEEDEEGEGEEGEEFEDEEEPRDEEYDEQAEQEAEEEMEKVTGNMLHIDPDLFGICVVDEAHRVKSARVLQTEAVYLLNPVKMILITATPMKNSVQELAGLLRFVYKAVAAELSDRELINHQAYRTLTHSFDGVHDNDILSLPRESMMEYLRGLNPKAYRAACNAHGTSEVEVGADIVPLPTAIAILRRVKGQELELLGQKMIIGEEIPPWTVVHLELRAGQWERGLYEGVRQACAQLSDTPIPVVESEAEAFQNTHGMARRRLTLASFNPYLDQFATRRVNANATVVNKKSLEGIDAFTFIHTWTKNDLHATVPSTRVDIGQWMTGPSVKLKQGVKLFHKLCIEEGQKVIAWCNEPLSCMEVEIIAETYEIPHVSIRAGLSNAARARAETAFNTDPNVKICVCSSRSCQESMNLQAAGHVMVVFDIVSFQALQQMLGRQHRIGQTQPVVVYVLVNDETIDQTLQATYFERYRANVISQTLIAEHHAKEVLKNLDAAEKLEMERVVSANEAESAMAFATSRLRGPYADAVIRELYGLRSNRTDAWKDSKDFTKKNLEPEEIIFRILYGGTVGREVMEALRARDAANTKSGDGAGDKREPPEKDPDEPQHAATKVLTRFNPLAQQLALPTIAPPFTAADAVRRLADAAEEMAMGIEFKLNNIKPYEILEAAADWVEKPPPYLQLAITRAGKPSETEAASTSARVEIDPEEFPDDLDEDAPLPANPLEPAVLPSSQTTTAPEARKDSIVQVEGSAKAPTVPSGAPDTATATEPTDGDTRMEDVVPAGPQEVGDPAKGPPDASGAPDTTTTPEPTAGDSRMEDTVPAGPPGVGDPLGGAPADAGGEETEPELEAVIGRRVGNIKNQATLRQLVLNEGLRVDLPKARADQNAAVIQGVLESKTRVDFTKYAGTKEWDGL